MAVFSWGALSVLAGYTDNYAYSTSIGLPTGALWNDGWNGVYGYAFGLYAAGKGGYRNCAVGLGGVSSGVFGLASAGSAQYYQPSASGWWAGGSATWTIDPDGSFYFGRGGGGTTYDSHGATWSGTLYGEGYYYQVPSVPTSFGIALNGVPGEIAVSWGAPVSNGEWAIIGYRVEWWDIASPGVKFAANVGVVSSTVISGLDRGKTWAVRVCARNPVSNARGTIYGGVWTNTLTIFLPGGGKVWDGSAYVNAIPKIWNGSTWVGASVLIWNGSAWVMPDL